MTDKFRHPVFGNRKVWVNQSMHPFLYRSMLANASRIEHFEGEIVAGAFREVGWHGA